MNFLNNRLKAIEKKVGLHEHVGFIIVFISSHDGSSVNIRATLSDGKLKTDTLHTENDLFNFFSGKSSDALCIMEGLNDVEPVEGSLYEKIKNDGVTSIGKVNINR